MGRGCNRKTLKMRRRNAWRRLKLRTKRKIEEAIAAAAAGGKKISRAAKAATPSAVRRTSEAPAGE